MTNKRELMRKFDELREEKGYSKADVCRELGVGTGFYSNWLRRGMPRGRLTELALAIGVTTNELLGNGESDFVYYNKSLVAAWLSAQASSEATVAFATASHRSWLLLSYNTDTRFVDVLDRELSAHELFTYCAADRALHCLELSQVQWEMVRTGQATSLEFFGEGKRPGWLDKVQLVNHDSPYAWAKQVSGTASDRSGVNELLRLAENFSDEDMDVLLRTARAFLREA